MNEISLANGTIRYRDTGSGPTVVLIHGLLVDGALWRKVVPQLEGRFRCVVPDLPLGSHTVAMNPDADLTPPGLARTIGEFLDKLDLNDVTLVANDTGGALTQILLASGDPSTARIARVVLTPCDSFDNFFPPMFRPLKYAARIPGAVNGVIQGMRAPAMRNLPMAYGWLTKRRMPDDVTAAWIRPCLTDKGVRRDTAKLLTKVDSKYTLEAADKLNTFTKPVLLAWAPEDRFFPIDHARRLADLFPDARVEEIPDSYTFVSEDQPDRTAELIAGFAGG